MAKILKELCAYPTEREWFEFKENWLEPEQLGTYISALSNSAASQGRGKAYFVWGVNDKTHEVTGTKFDPDCDVKGEPLKHFLARQLTPDLDFAFEEDTVDGKRIVLLTIPAAKTVPVSFANERNRIVERKEVSLFEDEAFREAMINAFVHNRWVEGNEPMISVFSDRIEILSRGPIPAGQTVDGFFAGESVPVNQKLSEIFLQLHISEKTGRGVPKVVEKYGKAAYEFRENTILVTIPFRWIHAIDSGNAPEEVKSTVKILNLIRENPNITRQEMAEKLNLSLEGIDKIIRKLKNNGQLSRVGPDKGGHWEIIAGSDKTGEDT